MTWRQDETEDAYRARVDVYIVRGREQRTRSSARRLTAARCLERAGQDPAALRASALEIMHSGNVTSIEGLKAIVNLPGIELFLTEKMLRTLRVRLDDPKRTARQAAGILGRDVASVLQQEHHALVRLRWRLQIEFPYTLAQAFDGLWQLDTRVAH